MKPDFQRAALLLLLLSTLNPQLSTARAQGTAFTYEGRFNTNSVPYTGSAEFQFTLWDAASDGNAVATNNPVVLIANVANGLFTATLDFGSAPFNGQPRFLQIDARTTIGAFTTLTPRQPLTPTPYALRALTLSSNGLAAGTYTSAVTFNNAGNSFAGTFTGAASGEGGGLTGLNASQLTSGTVADARLSTNVARRGTVWGLFGNDFGQARGEFLGSIDDQPLDFKVNNQRALRIEYASGSSGPSPNIVGGYFGNVVSNGSVGAVIVGGGSSNSPNRVGNDFATVVGGRGNTASGSSSTAMGFNSVASGAYSTAIGFDSVASGDLSTAMGYHARALHAGSFVWADSHFTPFASTADDQFCIRASGGVRLSDDTGLYFGSATRQMINLYGGTYGIGVQSDTTYFRSAERFSWFRNGFPNDAENDPGFGGSVLMSLTGGGLTVNGTVVSSSDRNVKAGFAPVDPQAILAKVIALPIQRWHFTNDASTPHVGPVAQDFHAAFHVGADNKHIATVDADGVALAAIQGLNRKLEQKLEQKQTEITELKQRFEALEKIVNEKLR